MGYHIDPRIEAMNHDRAACGALALAAITRWWIARWWYKRVMRYHEQQADIWRGLEWRREQAMGEA